MMINMEDNNYFAIGKFEMPYINGANFKEKEILNIANIINGSRIGENVYFCGYGNMSFSDEDNKHWYPRITKLDGFIRNKTNLMILNIKSNNKYNYIFIYQTTTKDSGFYGILMYNSETNDSLHIYNVEYDWSRLVIVLSRIVQNNKE